jgi:hypothetical protein
MSLRPALLIPTAPNTFKQCKTRLALLLPESGPGTALGTSLPSLICYGFGEGMEGRKNSAKLCIAFS